MSETTKLNEERRAVRSALVTNLRRKLGERVSDEKVGAVVDAWLSGIEDDIRDQADHGFARPPKKVRDEMESFLLEIEAGNSA